jgi:ABC-2 type transport system permease protein
MKGLFAIYRKELTDHFSSYRFVILFGLIAMVGLITTYMAGMNLRSNLEGMEETMRKFVFLKLFTTTGALFSLVQFVAFFGPLIGLVLGFDTINRERAHGTLIKLISQPIYRDAVINGKFLAGLTTISIMLVSIVLVISGFGLILLGVVPGFEEIWRLAIYLVISICYIAFWLGVAILFSILFRSIATSALASVALWIFLSFFVSLGASVIAGNVAPVDMKEGASLETVVKKARTEEAISLFSPMVLYSKATGIIIDPMSRILNSHAVLGMGLMERVSVTRFENPLSLGQSIFLVSSHIVALIAITLICFAISYLTFMLQEIRT